MSLPDEKKRALNNTREWLFQLLDRRYQPKMGEIRNKASHLLKHFPNLMDAGDMEKALNDRHERIVSRLKRCRKVPFCIETPMRAKVRNSNRLIRDVDRAHKSTAKSTLRFP
jgi:hypothetical protein